ncbi:MAG: serine hydrolase domain-containing protein [Sphingomicrobium sp.]
MRWLSSLAIGALALIGTVGFAQQQASLAPTLVPPAAAPAGAAPLATPPAPSGVNALTKSDVDAWLDGYLPYALKTGDIAGAEVVVVKDGQILTSRGYGYSDVEKRRPVDPDKTLFRPGSVSKLVTWTAVIQLVDEGKLALDRDVNEYLDFKIPPRDGKPITLRQLLNHTAGFEEAGKDLIAYDAKYSMPLGAYLKRYTPTRIFAPGTTPAYSNWGTSLAGYIVERASGMSFDDYIDRRIFAPLGMTNTTFRQPLPARLKANMALGYSRASEKPTPFEIVVPAPAGAMSSTATDMGRFMLAHLQGGALGGNRILSPRAWQTMHNSPLTILPPLNRMQLGFFETNVNGRQVNAHLGDTLGFHSSLHLFMREGVGFYVSFNSGGKEGAVGALRGAMFHDFADRYFPGVQRDARVDPKVAAEHAKAMAGNWIVSRRWESNYLKFAGLLGQATISTDDKGQLVVSNLLGPSGVPRKWDEIAPFVWRDADGEDRLAAQVVDGRPVRWSMDFMSPFMVFDRAPAGQSAGWIMPALYASLAVLALTFFFWPAAWLVRRQYKSELAVTGRARQAYRATRAVAGLSLAVLIGWLVVVSVLLADASKLNASSDFWLWLLQILGAVVFIGAVLVSGWNAWLTWTDGRRWTRKLWSVLILLASLLVLYVAYTFGLISMTVNY